MKHCFGNWDYSLWNWETLDFVRSRFFVGVLAFGHLHDAFGFGELFLFSLLGRERKGWDPDTCWQ